ncbi:MAG: GH1 family beta-glucosidase [Planctomycetota bacterium]
MSFPSGFVWGAATSAYQIEGGHTQHGRGPSVWDAFCRQPGRVRGGETGDVAADHVNRFREDVGIMRDMGLGAYRLSISWPRVMPDGVGAVSEPGLAFYDRLIDELLSAGITPWVTLFHWDLPLPIHHRGGWLNDASPDWFDEFTKAVVDRLSDRVSHWFTINEPQVFIGLGYGNGEHAPGLSLPMDEKLRIGHNCLRAHGRSARTIRERARTAPEIGWAPVGIVGIPADPASDLDAARTKTFGIGEDPIWSNTWWSDPAMLGEYPSDGLEKFGHLLPVGWERDMELVRQPLDYYGVNIYRGEYVRAAGDGRHEVLPLRLGTPRSDFGWEITPDVLRWGPQFFFERYGKPIVISENGMSNADWVNLEGRVEDPQRVDYLARHLLAVQDAIRAGVAVKGYFHWSMLDNFEWAEGYQQRFGLVHVDFVTQKRTPKRSAEFYRRIIESNGELLESMPNVSETSSSFAVDLPGLQREDTQ